MQENSPQDNNMQKNASHCPVLGAIIARFYIVAALAVFPRVGHVMWIEKLADGVLELDTPIGPRYVQPNFTQRICLMWTFRNFFTLPQPVLRPWERRLIDRLWSESRFVSMPAMGAPNRPVIGIVEQRAPAQAEVVPIRKPPLREPMSGSKPAVAEQRREAVSA